MTAIGLMLEGQMDLNWARCSAFRRRRKPGLSMCIRSDHFTTRNRGLDSLEAWVALTYPHRDAAHRVRHARLTDHRPPPGHAGANAAASTT